MEIRYLLHMIRQHWLFVTAVSVVAFLGGLAATYILSEKYEATTKILIRPREEVNLGPTYNKAMLDYPVSVNIPAESMSRTFAEILASEAIAIRVVDSLQLDKLVPEPDPRWYVRVYDKLKDWSKIAVKYSWDFVRYGRVEHRDPYWKAVEDVLDGLEAEPMGDTYLFSLTATWDNPKTAALVADTVAKIFVDYNLESSRNEDGTSAESLGERAEILRLDLEAARKRMEEFNERTHAPKLDYQLSIVLEREAEFEAQREETDRQLREVGVELKTLNAQLAEQPKEVYLGTLMSKNPVTQTLEQEAARYEVELAGLERTHLPAHPEMKALLAKIDRARTQIQAEAREIRFQESLTANPLHQDLSKKLLERSAAEASLRERRAALDKTVATYEKEANRLTAEQDELARLSLDLSVLEGEYKMVRQQYGEARLAAVQEISEIRILNPAIAPLYPVSPIKLYYAGGALVVGFLLALSALLVLDYTQPALVTPEEVEDLLGAPVLVSVPRRMLPAGTSYLLGPGASSASFGWEILGGDYRSSRGRFEDG